MKHFLAKLLAPFWLWLNDRCITPGCEFPRYKKTRLCKMHDRQQYDWVKLIDPEFLATLKQEKRSGGK